MANSSILRPMAALDENPKLQPGPGSSNASAPGHNARRASHSSSGRPDPLSSITHASVRARPGLRAAAVSSGPPARQARRTPLIFLPCWICASVQASRIGPGVIPTGLRIVPHGELTAEEKAKRLAAYAAVDAHVKEHHKVLGIGSVAASTPSSTTGMAPYGGQQAWAATCRPWGA